MNSSTPPRDPKGSSPIIPFESEDFRWNKLFKWSAQAWFTVAVIGQIIFAIYVALNYGVPAFENDYQAWNETLPHGHEEGNTRGNFFIGAHLFFAVVITLGGPLQLIPKVRSIVPRFHRWNGRVYVFTALLMSLSGLYLTLSGRKLVGDFSQHGAIIINALLIIFFAVMATRTAIERNFKAHRKWALRLYLMVSGVWLFRVGLMFWLFANRGPVGFDMKSFSGPFLSILAFIAYFGSLVFLELYLRAFESKRSEIKLVVAIGLISITLAMALGVFAATMGMWIPRIS